MRSYRFVGQVVVVCCFYLLSLVACAPDKETIDPATRRAAEATTTASTRPRSATATAVASPLSATAALATAPKLEPVTAAGADEAITPPQVAEVTPAPLPTYFSCPDDVQTDGPPQPAPTGLLRVLFRNNSNDLWLWREETGTAEALTSGSNVVAYELTPDKRAVVFLQAGDVWLWRQESGAARLTDSGDLNRFLLSSDGVVIVFGRALADEQYELWAVNSDGSPARRLATVSAAETRARYPEAVNVQFDYSWVGDSHMLVYGFSPIPDGIGETPPPPFLMDADRGMALPIAPAAAYYQYQLSPNGTQIVAQTADSRELHLINVADGQVQLALPVPDMPAWTFSPNGRYFIASAAEGAVIVDMVDLSQQRLAIPYRSFPHIRGTARPPDFWVDETRWYTAIPEPGDTSTLWRIDVAEATATAMNTFSGHVHSVLFSPDRRYLIVPDVVEVVLVDTADASQQRLPMPYGIIFPDLAGPPDFWVDETRWYMLVPDSDDYYQAVPFTLWRINAAAGTATTINSFPSDIFDSVVVFSPDYRFLALLEGDNLHLVDTNTGQEVGYESGRFGLRLDRWQSDSAHFVYHYWDAEMTQSHAQIGHICRPPVPLDPPIDPDPPIPWWNLEWVDERRYLIVKDGWCGPGEPGTLYLQSLDGESTLITTFLAPLCIGPSYHVYFEGSDA